MTFSIIVPLLNEAEELPALLQHLHFWRERGCEVLLVDGGSTDGSPERARQAGFVVLQAPRGRARQMNAGAERARGDVFVFLHADTRLPSDMMEAICGGLRASGYAWGRFDVNLRGNSRLFPIIAFLMNWRSRLSGIATGDQAIFIRRHVFFDCGGFPDQLLMEDIELSRRLKRLTPPLCLRTRATTSGRRWERWGVWRTILLMWSLRFLYWVGVPAKRLARAYAYP